jgi:phenylacetate-coenzyme A ligase PaaK-like adenylate-forming protein
MHLTPLEPWIARKIGVEGAPLTRSCIEAYQVERIRDTLRRCQRSPFYRAHLAGLPAEISGLDELSAFPFTTAEDIRREALRFLCVSQSDIHRVVTLDTSGTTGQPKRLYFSRADQELTIDFFQVGMSTFTDPGDRVLILLPCERPGSVGDLLATALKRLGAEGIRHGVVRDIPETLRVLHQERATGIVGIPVQVLALARSKQPDGFPAPRLKSVLLTTDHVPQAIARAVESAWGCVVYNHYGMTEMGLGGGVECAARRGCHLREADLYVEIIDPETGARLEDGKAGEIVFTTLTREGMPLVRYRTGDISRFIPGDCPCGTVLKTLERVKCRVSGIIQVSAAHTLTMAHLDEALFSVEGVLNFDATWSGDALHLRVQVAEGSGALPALSVALRTIPALRDEAVDVRLHVQTQHPARPPAPAKRTITV